MHHSSKWIRIDSGQRLQPSGEPVQPQACRTHEPSADGNAPQPEPPCAFVSLVTPIITSLKAVLPFLSPRGGRSSPETLDSTLLLFVAQDRSHHVAANARANLSQFADRKLPCRRRTTRPCDQALYSGKDQFALGTARCLDLADTLGKFPVTRFQDEEHVIDVRPRVVLTLVPALRAHLQRFVVTHLVLLDQAFETDVVPNLETKLVTLQQPDQARDATIAVAKGMNAQKVEVKRGQRNQWRNPAFREAVLPERLQLCHRVGGCLLPSRYENVPVRYHPRNAR